MRRMPGRPPSASGTASWRRRLFSCRRCRPHGVWRGTAGRAMDRAWPLAGIGRRTGLKIRRAMPVWVRVPQRLPDRPCGTPCLARTYRRPGNHRLPTVPNSGKPFGGNGDRLPGGIRGRTPVRRDRPAPGDRPLPPALRAYCGPRGFRSTGRFGGGVHCRPPCRRIAFEPCRPDRRNMRDFECAGADTVDPRSGVRH